MTVERQTAIGWQLAATSSPPSMPSPTKDAQLTPSPQVEQVEQIEQRIGK
jgi:hypothetical protein